MDYTGKTCRLCLKGIYKETSFFDDMDGTLHCDKCGHTVYRYGEEWHIKNQIDLSKMEIKYAKQRIASCMEREQEVIKGQERKIKELTERLKQMRS